MKIAVLSGKGGTGKTTISTNLAVNIKNSILIDTDVEEPNAHIFMKPLQKKAFKVNKNYPEIDKEKCKLCGKCGEFCRYNSIIPAKNTVLLFKESCHDCGGCKLVCPEDAISYKEREIGKIYNCISQYETKFLYGELNIGEMSGVKIIKELKQSIINEERIIIDCPPGTSCATVEAVEDSDYAIIVSEPTPFGVSDMKMVVEMLSKMKIPFGIVVNKSGLGNSEIYDYCLEEKINILEEIPFNKNIAKNYASGKIFSLEMEEYKVKFIDLFNKISKRIGGLKIEK